MFQKSYPTQNDSLLVFILIHSAFTIVLLNIYRILIKTNDFVNEIFCAGYFDELRETVVETTEVCTTLHVASILIIRFKTRQSLLDTCHEMTLAVSRVLLGGIPCVCVKKCFLLAETFLQS